MSVNLFSKLFGGKKMAALSRGVAAPDFALDTLDRKRFSLQDALARGPAVLAFFKVSCPTCQYAFPFLERLVQAYPKRRVTVVGISQNTAQDTAAFAREHGLTFPILLDDTSRYPVSNAYGLTNVPTIFWIAGDGEIEISSVGWVKSDFEQLNRRMAEAESLAPQSIFHLGEDVRDFRAG